MTDPVQAAVVAAGGAANSATNSAAQETGRLLQRALGPTADVFGAWLADKVEYRLHNIGRIANAATKRGADGSPVSPRVVNKILEEGSFVDNSLGAEYFGGVLAASGTSDAGVVWASLLGQLSSAQIRAHFILYRELHLAGRDLPTGVGNLLVDTRCFIELGEAIRVLGSTESKSQEAAVFQHASAGLERAGLIQHLGWKVNSEATMTDSPYPQAMSFRPTPAGIELYGWSQGQPHITGGTLRELKADPFDVDPPTPRLTTTVFPDLERKRNESQSDQSSS